MMQAGKKAIATAVALGISAGFAVPVTADAAVDTSKSYQVGVTTGAGEGFQNVDVNKGRVSWLMYNSLSNGLMPTAFYLDAYADGQKVDFAGDATKVDAASNADGDVVTLTHTDDKLGVELVRTFTVSPTDVDVRVELRSLSGKKNLKVVLTDGFMSYDYPITADEVGADGFSIDVGGRYQLQSQFHGATTTSTGDSQTSAAAGQNDGSRFQAGVWEADAASLSARMSIHGDANEALTDTDGDGFPDDWELNGFTSSDGTEFPLHRWGADPNKKDLFLQLNWMKSEWETKGCSEKRQYAATEEDFGRFMECADANVNVYRPSRAILNDLVDLFDRRGYNLHIDAGDYYNNIPGLSDTHGGPTVDYTPYYFGNEVPGVRLVKDRKNLLGARQSVFRVGVIGDTQQAGNLSSGNGLISDGAFYVAKNYLMTSQEQMRNTILHEFGHNLGLTHSGASSVDRPDHSYVPKYRSVMNYLYQFSHFDYSDTTASSNDSVSIPEACYNGSANCYNGSYNIKPDWDNLDVVNGEIAKANGSVGVTTDPEESGHEHPSVDKLVVLAAEENNGMAGLRVMGERDGKKNVIVANRSDSKINLELSNLGIDLHKFTLQADYPGGTFRQEYPVEGALSDYAQLPVEVPIANTAGYKDSTMPVKFRVFNEDGKLVAEENVDFSVLNYTTEQMDQLVKELEKNSSPLLNDARDTVAKIDPAKPTLAKPAPVATTSNKPVQPGSRGPVLTELNGATSEPAAPAKPKPSTTTNTKTQSKPADQAGAKVNATGKGGDSGSNAGIIVGVIIAILAVLGLGGAAAAMSGAF
ncbi:hypothetical protein [Corynebacterium fournieri]|uniref:hypothetical protein n=1 Tax=Corynebacterium fournieri TaxID=1852390 RepID=UPI000A2F027E|nr:hypothetical protein [Corynebacterium fournieri]WJY98348.1 hypothetical protein CFOUR_09820 [Corynebacterium fournieri]